jgi:hypothetical protein
MSWLILADVPGLGWSPVFFWALSATLRKTLEKIVLLLFFLNYLYIPEN